MTLLPFDSAAVGSAAISSAAGDFICCVAIELMDLLPVKLMKLLSNLDASITTTYVSPVKIYSPFRTPHELDQTAKYLLSERAHLTA